MQGRYEEAYYTPSKVIRNGLLRDETWCVRTGKEREMSFVSIAIVFDESSNEDLFNR